MDRKIPFLLLIVFALVLLSSCASSGRKMEESDLNKIVVGKTTKTEMMQMFGPPISQSYGTEGKLTMLWHYVYVGPFGTGMVQQNLAVLFDQQERVEKYNIVDTSRQ